MIKFSKILEGVAENVARPRAGLTEGVGKFFVGRLALFQSGDAGARASGGEAVDGVEASFICLYSTIFATQTARVVAGGYGVFMA